MSTLWLAFIALGIGVWLAHDGLVPRPPSSQTRREWSPVGRARDWLAQADLPGVTLWHLVVLCAIGSLAGGIAGYLAMGVPVTMVLGAAGGALTVPIWVRTRHSRRRPARQRAIAEALERMRDTLGGGLTLDHAFQSLADKGPQALQRQFHQFAAEAAASHRLF